MTPIKFPGCNVVYGKDQENYIPLPANFSKVTGMAITQWQFSDEEIAEICKNKRMFIGISTFGQPLQPILPTVLQIFHPGEEPELPTEPEVSETTEATIGKDLGEKDFQLCKVCLDPDTCIKSGCVSKTMK